MTSIDTAIDKLESDVVLPAGEPLLISLAEGGHWYGHGFNHVQPWPLETGGIDNPAFAVNNIQCPVWMCSKGLVLFAETVAPLAVSINRGGDGMLRICCPGSPVAIRVFRGANLPEAHAKWLRHAGWPNPPPRAEIFGDSLFCTWTQFPRCITQARVLEMARQIRAHGYPCRTLLIDDRWERCFGELVFSEVDFPDPAGMFAELKSLGFDAWLWVTPFVNREAANFAELACQRILVPSRSSGGAALLTWWGGVAGLVDVTAPQGREWYRGKLEALLELGAAGFKIDGGDHKYHPPADDCVWHANPGASGYSDALLELFDELVPNRCETRTAWLSQRRAILWREGGKDSHWGADNGLKAVLSLGLNTALLGYDLLIPDMVPGRVQTMNAADPLPSDELMVRWTEVSAFFPFLQFSYYPWNYTEATARAVAAYAQVHKALESYLGSQSTNRVKPLLRPLWYDWPEESALFAVSDEFMLGDDLLAAPVLDPGVVARDIILPPGVWVDAWTQETVSGALRQWPAPCPGIPLFVKPGNPDLLATLNRMLATIHRGGIEPNLTTATWQAGLTRDLNVTG
jgi:alpha-glucosidase (family GH31 glycosyl hydrolase)